MKCNFYLQKFVAKFAFSYAIFAMYCLIRKVTKLCQLPEVPQDKSESIYFNIALAILAMMLIVPAIWLWILRRLPGHCRQCGASLSVHEKRCTICGVPNPMLQINAKPGVIEIRG